MSTRRANEATDLGHRYIAGWADSANKRSGGTGGATDAHMIFLQGQSDGADPRVGPTDPVKYVAPKSLEEAIVMRLRHEVARGGPMFLQLATGQQITTLYRALEKVRDEILDEGTFVPVPSDDVKEEPAPAPTGRAPETDPSKPFGG